MYKYVSLSQNDIRLDQDSNNIHDENYISNIQSSPTLDLIHHNYHNYHNYYNYTTHPLLLENNKKETFYLESRKSSFSENFSESDSIEEDEKEMKTIEEHDKEELNIKNKHKDDIKRNKNNEEVGFDHYMSSKHLERKLIRKYFLTKEDFLQVKLHFESMVFISL